jgi:hypothetical protein
VRWSAASKGAATALPPVRSPRGGPDRDLQDPHDPGVSGQREQDSSLRPSGYDAVRTSETVKSKSTTSIAIQLGWYTNHLP